MGEKTTPDFQALFEEAPGLYLVLDADLTIVAVSHAYTRATLTDRATIVGRKLFDVFPDNPDDADATGVSNLRASLTRVLKTRASDSMAVQKYDIRTPEAEGGTFEERHWSPINSPVLAPDGSVRYIIHRVEDVTEFVRATEQRSATEKLTRELRSRVGSMETEVYRRAQEIQETNRKLVALQDELEQRVVARTDELRLANDALRSSEEQLRQAQKLEAVGRLAGGIAHDFNNLLSVILSYSDLLALEMGAKSPHAHDLDEIRKAGRRAAELTRQMLAFSRQQILEPRVLDLNAIVEGMTSMLKRMLGEDLELRTSFAPDLGRVRADLGQIEQVLMNLVVNARDAMPNGGTLTVETANVELDATYVASHPGASPGPHAMIAVSDTGVGMDREVQSRIFEPFFTTKDQGKGTGLGLATVFGIVKESGGTIWLYSEPGVGSTFKIYLPHTDAALDGAKLMAPPSEQSRGTETILLVEDEEQVRTVAVGILRRAGYAILEASSSDEALAWSEKHDGPIHVVITDVVMPRMSGRQLASRIAAMRPTAKILFMSGYTNDAILQHGVLEPGVAYIQKPLTPDSLTRRVREVLDRPLH